ncbi:ATP-binding protein [Jeotgalicoccus nanhaiensis]|uniref:DUF2075 domain-containing protein n=1 Tax=Jeotgalicoccus nanhaiensis TaxID=568603 RepID=A0ABR9XXL5_9STAP|nr:ATP-binding protein [Jeotgalicoccus nanhaiensis]MBF0753455.1 DUF2075 domain-containing protein [Jeotgalicoccus nanhaiensis]TFU62615.1 ATP-binding protein [Jeotgalicoccus nanhaiensis]
MHKPFNLDYYSSIYELNDDYVLQSFIKLNDHKYLRDQDDSIDHEYRDLYLLVKSLKSKSSIEQRNGYFLGYKLESKIDEEFDLLRFSEDSILNIELKLEVPKRGMEQIEDQLRRHKFILSALNKTIYSYVYITSENMIYKLNENNSLVKSSFKELIHSISDDYLYNNELEKIDVNKFIVSPYSHPQAFINHSYYLSQDQRDKKLEIMSSTRQRICIEGEAGTGKTLLLYDIAKELTDEGYKVLMLFCGNLENHHQLAETFEFQVKPIKLYENYIEEYDLIMVDEAQRIYPSQLEKILEYQNKKIYFAFDYRQVLSTGEKQRKVFEDYRKNTEFKFIKLRNKIRTNHETIAFIEKLLKTNVRHHHDYDYKDINVAYFDSKETSNDFIKELYENEYLSIELTEYITRTSGKTKRSNIHRESLQVHNVIGREYDDIIIILDNHYYYDDEGYLCSSYSEYYPYLEVEGIYQALTRAKGKIFLIIIDNPDVYIKVQRIFTRKFDKSLSLPEVE